TELNRTVGPTLIKKEAFVNRFAGVVVSGIVCFALGAGVMRYYDTHRAAPQSTAALPALPADNKTAAAIKFDEEPLWAYGFEMPPKPGEKAQPQAPPNRNLRPNQDAAEQTRVRHLEGSK